LVLNVQTLSAVVSSLLLSYLDKHFGMGTIFKRIFLFIWLKYFKHPPHAKHWA
jgi:hypothetical protein